MVVQVRKGNGLFRTSYDLHADMDAAMDQYRCTDADLGNKSSLVVAKRSTTLAVLKLTQCKLRKWPVQLRSCCIRFRLGIWRLMLLIQVPKHGYHSLCKSHVRSKKQNWHHVAKYSDDWFVGVWNILHLVFWAQRGQTWPCQGLRRILEDKMHILGGTWG